MSGYPEIQRDAPGELFQLYDAQHARLWWWSCNVFLERRAPGDLWDTSYGRPMVLELLERLAGGVTT
jgi:uncharacterized protein (DUF2384 family)